MKTSMCLLAATASLAAVVAMTSAVAGANEYAFEPVNVEVKNGSGSELVVRLIHKPSGKPVMDAVIFRSRVDMSPENMEAMTANHEAVSSTEPGVYRFKADLTMEGGWALKLMAKVQGEQETVSGTIIFKAKN